VNRIASVEAFRVELPVTKTFIFASGSAGAAGSSAPDVFVKVTDDEGRVGWGEGRPSPAWSYETAETMLATIRDYLAPAVIGLPTTDRWGLHQAMRRVIGLGPSTGQPIAKASVDIAVHDLCARAAGLTLRSFLGGADTRAEIPLSYTLTDHAVPAVREDIAAAREASFRHFNFKVAVEPTTDAQIAAAVREDAGDGAFVWADANQGLRLHEARALCSRLAEAGVDVLEQPLQADMTHLMPALRQATALPLAVDESSVSPSDFFRLAAAGVVDYLVVKVTRSGGLWPTLQQIAVAEAAGLGLLVSGLTDSLITKLAACQIAATVGYSGPAGLNGSQFMDDSHVFPAKHEVEADGMVRLGPGLGVGIEPDEAAVRHLATDAINVASS
jgi:L-alanine-DL-glutamate epimerase-like enolase superfamily enzyme